MGKEFEYNKIYITKCKQSTDWCIGYNVMAGEYYRCKRKLNVAEDIKWHTDHDKEYPNFGFSWSWDGWYEHFEKPIEIPKAKDIHTGDELLCIQDFHMRTDGRRAFTKGIVYKVVKSENGMVDFIDDDDQEHGMSGEYLSYFVSTKKKVLFFLHQKPSKNLLKQVLRCGDTWWKMVVGKQWLSLIFSQKYLIMVNAGCATILEKMKIINLIVMHVSIG